MSTSLEETFFIIALPDPRVPMIADEDLPKVEIYSQLLLWLIFITI
jgi:hypothetical protein